MRKIGLCSEYFFSHAAVCPAWGERRRGRRRARRREGEGGERGRGGGGGGDNNKRGQYKVKYIWEKREEEKQTTKSINNTTYHPVIKHDIYVEPPAPCVCVCA